MPAETVRYILEKAEQADARVYVAAAITRGLGEGELCDLEALRAAGAAAFSNDGRGVIGAGEIVANNFYTTLVNQVLTNS